MTHVLCSIISPPPENQALYEIVWKKCCTAGDATDDNMAHAHCFLDTYSYKHTLRICDTYWFSTATMVVRTRLTVPLYVHCLSCSFAYFMLDVDYIAANVFFVTLI
jgi:hypothetical protein